MAGAVPPDPAGFYWREIAMESGTESSKRDQDKASIADLIGAVVECWNRHDMRSLANLCAPDVDAGP